MIKLVKMHKLFSVLALSAIALIWVSSNRFWGDYRWNNILVSDGPGYYAYLPALVVYHDLSFGFFDKVQQGENRENLQYDYRVKAAGHNINKYFAGTAFVQLPFYVVGHLVTVLSSGATDGYSKWYLIFFHIGALFYCLLGLFVFWRIMKLYRVPEGLSAFLLIVILFGTNLYHYTVNEPAMSHVYSFAFVNLFVYQGLLFFRNGKRTHLFLGLFFLGIITLIRPVNLMVVLSAPFLSGDFSVFKEQIVSLFRNPLNLLIGVLIFLIVVFIQLLIYKIETGNFIVYSYGEEGINFLHPHIVDFLVSYKKGFFVYTPIAFFSLFGAGYLWKRSRFEFFSWALFLLLVVYVLSSWWMWFYGGSFSSRVMVEYLTFFFIPLALWLSKTKYLKWLKMFIVVLMIVNLIQIYQYQYGYIHWSDMNKERYWNNFLRIDKVMKHQRDW